MAAVEVAAIVGTGVLVPIAVGLAAVVAAGVLVLIAVEVPVAVGAAATVAVGVPMEVSDGVAVGFEPNGLPCVAIRPAMADTSSTTIPRSPASILVITGPSYHCCI